MTVLNMTPTTELDAVNVMLDAATYARVSTLDGTLSSEVSTAVGILSRTNRAVQNKGWHFNTEEDYQLPTDVNGKIPFGDNILRVDVDNDASIDTVRRGKFLYDRKNHTFIFKNSVKATVVLLLPFEDLPESARHYISVRAARRLQAVLLGESTAFQIDDDEERDAWADLQVEEMESADHSVLNDPTMHRIATTRRSF